MASLTWIGKEAVLGHHREVPYHLLRGDQALSIGEDGGVGSGNLLVQGDNLLALKALLPYYAGRVKCIYIDPPYNTGNEGRITGQSNLFVNINLDGLVPADHPLRAIKPMADQALAEMGRTFAAAHSPVGRPSVPPERLLKALVLSQRKRRQSKDIFGWLKQFGGLRRARVVGRWKIQQRADIGLATLNMARMSRLLA
jgi:hypothetical protein